MRAFGTNLAAVGAAGRGAPLLLLLLAVAIGGGRAAPAAAQEASVPEPAAAADTLAFQEDAAWAADSVVFQDFPEDDLAWLKGEAVEGVVYQPELAFNRVDGWTFGGHIGCKPSAGWMPRFDARVAVASDRGHRGIYVLEIAQPVLPGRRLLLGWQQRRWTDGMEGDDERVGSTENFASAFLFRRDYRDYVERDGTSLFAQAAPLPWLAVGATYASHEYRSLPDVTPNPSTVFRKDSPWRSNPAADEGRMQSAVFDAVVDRRDKASAPRRGGWLRLECETSGPDLHSDFTFTRYQAEARGYMPLTFGLDLKGRLLVGTTGAGALPVQKEFAVGGISTLRGHSYKHHRGDHVFLFNAEGGLLLWRGRQRSGVRADVRLLAFADIGQAWQGKSYDLASRQMMSDAGLGLGIAEGRIRLYAAHDLRDADSGFLWTLRLDNPF